MRNPTSTPKHGDAHALPITRAVIADDEPVLAEHLARELKLLWPQLQIDGIARNGREALALVRAYDPDVVFLDIRMPGIDGFAVARALPPDVALVFVTAFEEHAVAAFERAAVDYLVKPVTRERLGQTVSRLQALLASGQATARTTEQDLREAAGGLLKRLLNELGGDSGQPASTAGAAAGRTAGAADARHALLPATTISASEPSGNGRPLQWLRAGQADRVELLHVNEVVYFEADLKYTSVKTRDRELLLRKPLSELEAELDPDSFWRVHRSLIVNVSQIGEARRDLRGRYVLSLRTRPERLRVSQRYAAIFRQM